MTKEKEQLEQKIIDLLHWRVCEFNYGNQRFVGSLTHESEEIIARKLVNLIEQLGYRLILGEEDLPLLNNQEKLECSLISKYPYKDIRDVINEVCLHERHLIAE